MLRLIGKAASMSKADCKHKSCVDVKSKILDPKWANDCLHYGIEVLKGYAVVCRSFQDRVTVALAIRDNLLSCGFPWQAERLDNWIHFFERQNKDLEARIRGGSRP